MKYRQFGQTGKEVSALGLGAMRLPIDQNGNIDRASAIQLVRHAIDNGVNYVDTAWPYHGGDSEVLLGEALQGGYRDKTMLVTKMPRWNVKKYEDFETIFQKQLSKLQTTWLDCYLIHALNADAWKEMRDLGVIEWAQSKKKSGEMRHFGFSFHGSIGDFKTIIDDYDQWDLCMVQYNYMDIHNQAGTEGVQYAAAKGLPVITMEPLLGGKLAGEPPEPVKQVWQKSETQRKPVEWALEWLWNQPEVSVVLSGMSTLPQLDENLALADQSCTTPWTPKDEQLVAEARTAFHQVCPVPCTQCNYCQPCPEGVKIPKMFTIYNQGKMYNNMQAVKNLYPKIPETEKVSQCTDCGKCETACPQHIEIRDWLKRIDTELKGAVNA